MAVSITDIQTSALKGLKLKDKVATEAQLQTFETNIESAMSDLAVAGEITVVETDGADNSGLLKTYEIYQGLTDTEKAGTKPASKKVATINQPRDFLLKSGSLGTVSAVNTPYTGAAVGDKYLDLVLNVKDAGTEADTHVYVPVNDLFDSYTSGSAAGAAIQITVDNATNKITATCNISGSATIASVSSGVVTLKAGLTQTSGVVSNNSGSDITLAKVATTGAAADVSVAADATSGLTAGTVQGTLQDLKSSIDANDIEIATGSTDGTIKYRKGGTGAYTEVTPKNLKNVATTGAAADVSIADADSVITATTVEGALAEIAKEIDAMDATTTASTASEDTSSIQGISVVTSVTQTDGKLTTISTAKADKYGSASKAKADVIGAASDASSASTIYGAKKKAQELIEAIGTAATTSITDLASDNDEITLEALALRVKEIITLLKDLAPSA